MQTITEPSAKPAAAGLELPEDFTPSAGLISILQRVQASQELLLAQLLRVAAVSKESEFLETWLGQEYEDMIMKMLKRTASDVERDAARSIREIEEEVISFAAQRDVFRNRRFKTSNPQQVLHAVKDVLDDINDTHASALARIEVLYKLEDDSESKMLNKESSSSRRRSEYDPILIEERTDMRDLKAFSDIVERRFSVDSNSMSEVIFARPTSEPYKLSESQIDAYAKSEISTTMQVHNCKLEMKIIAVCETKPNLPKDHPWLVVIQKSGQAQGPAQAAQQNYYQAGYYRNQRDPKAVFELGTYDPNSGTYKKQIDVDICATMIYSEGDYIALLDPTQTSYKARIYRNLMLVHAIDSENDKYGNTPLTLPVKIAGFRGNYFFYQSNLNEIVRINLTGSYTSELPPFCTKQKAFSFWKNNLVSIDDAGIISIWDYKSLNLVLRQPQTLSSHFKSCIGEKGTYQCYNLYCDNELLMTMSKVTRGQSGMSSSHLHSYTLKNDNLELVSYLEVYHETQTSMIETATCFKMNCIKHLALICRNPPFNMIILCVENNLLRTCKIIKIPDEKGLKTATDRWNIVFWNHMLAVVHAGKQTIPIYTLHFKL